MSHDTVVVKDTEPVPGMLLISPQAVMFEPTDYQSTAPADDEVAAAGYDDAVQRDWIIVPMDSISSIMISHHCDAMSTRSIYIYTYLHMDGYKLVANLLRTCCKSASNLM